MLSSLIEPGSLDDGEFCRLPGGFRRGHSTKLGLPLLVMDHFSNTTICLLYIDFIQVHMHSIALWTEWITNYGRL